MRRVGVEHQSPINPTHRRCVLARQSGQGVARHPQDIRIVLAGLDSLPGQAQSRRGFRPRGRYPTVHVLDRMQDRLDRMPEAMGVRRQTVEHPFGTLKAWMGATHFLTRTLDKVRTEMSLHVLAYNLKRMITIFGVGQLMAAIRT